MKKWFVRIKDFIMASGDMHISAFAGQSVFFIFMSFFPLLNILLSLVPLFSISEAEMTQMITKAFPEDLGKYLGGIIKDIYSNGAPSFTIISVVVGLWASAKGLMAIRNGLNEIYHSREKKNYFVIRGISALYTLIFLVAMIVLTMLNLFGRQILDQIKANHQEIGHVTDLIDRLSGVGSFLLVFILLWGMYTMLPSRRLLFRYQAVGAVFTASAWALVSSLFSLYIDYSISKSAMYGSLTTIISLLLWLYIMVNLIFIGAQINEFLYMYVYKDRAKALAEKKRKLKALKAAGKEEQKASRKEARRNAMMEKLRAAEAKADGPQPEDALTEEMHRYVILSEAKDLSDIKILRRYAPQNDREEMHQEEQPSGEAPAEEEKGTIQEQ